MGPRGVAALLLLGAVLPAAARESRIAPPDSYARQLSLRIQGGLTHPELTEARMSLHDESGLMRSTGWTGGIDEGDVSRGYGGGLEAAWGLTGDVKVSLALEGLGASAAGNFEGNGPGTTTMDPVLGVLRQRVTRLDRYAAALQWVGATVLLRDFEWSRLGLVGKAGAVELAGAVERGRESGPLRQYWWQRTLSGAAPAIWIGLEWEWLAPAASLGVPLSGFVSLGGRWADVRNITGTHTDSTGASTTGAWKHPDGTHRTLDFSGMEIRFGLQLLFDLTPEDGPVRPGLE